MEVTYKEILEAKERGKKDLNEASLGRVYQHTVRSGEKSYGILTSWRSTNNKATNLKNFAELQHTLGSLGLGFFKMKGHWQECQDPNVSYDECPPEELVDSAEPSLFVPGISRTQIEKLMNKYKQDAIIYSGPETEGNVTLIFRSGAEQNLGKFSPGKIAQAYSSVKGRNFIFEYVAQTWSEKLIKSLLT